MEQGCGRGVGSFVRRNNGFCQSGGSNPQKLQFGVEDYRESECGKLRKRQMSDF